MRLLVAIVAGLTVLILAVDVHATTSGWSTVVASAYSHHSSGPVNGCDGSLLRDDALTVATYLVPCGAHLQVCAGGRCVTVTRRDSGPAAWTGAQLDLNIGVVRALGVASERAWGHRVVRWRRVG